MQTFYNKKGEQIERTPCQIYTRVMGYLRPVSHFNTGKKSEFYSRKYFEENKSMNAQFTQQFSSLGEMYNLVEGYKDQVQFIGCGCEA
jgi:hypothetical protein